jgi:crotonobetaine/carnitine-CoA ligase
MRQQSEIEQLIRQRAHLQPDEPWLHFKDETFAWREVISHSQRAANGFLELGLRPGDRVGLMAGNRPEFLWAYFGALMIGSEVVPINKWQRGAALEHMFRDSGIHAVVYDPELDPVIAEMRRKVPGLRWAITLVGPKVGTADATMTEFLNSARDRDPPIEVTQRPGAVGILYTSGTTGPPKGIVSKNYEPCLRPLIEALDIRPREVMYTCMPLFHASGLLVFGVGSIRQNAQLALGDGFSASGFWDEIRRYKAVSANVFGVMIPFLLKQPLRSNDRDNPMRCVLSVGCPKSAWQEFEQRFDLKVVEFYGASDAPGFLINRDGRAGSVGKPAAGAEFRVVDEYDNDVPVGKTGEIIYRHRGEHPSAYNNLPDVTAQVWRGDWYHSGDIGEIDKDGFFYFHGRMKEAIRRRGENISPWEISSVLDLHPKVQESAAFGVPAEDGEEEVMVAVVPQPNAILSPEELLDFCQGRLAYYALPRYVDIVSKLPKTSTQKIQHLALKEKGRSEMTWDRERAKYVVQRA